MYHFISFQVIGSYAYKVQVFHLIEHSLDLILRFKGALHFTLSTGQTVMVPTIDLDTHSTENCLSLSQVPILPLGGGRHSL